MMRSMAATVFIDSAANPRLADYRALTDVELRRRSEPAEGVFIAEGELVMRRAVRAGYPMRSALTSERWLPTVLSLADRVVVMKKGRIVREFAAETISKDKLLEAA